MICIDLGKVLTEKCPKWATGTLLLRDEKGNLVGYGFVRRTEEGADVQVSASPSGVRFLSSSPPATSA